MDHPTVLYKYRTVSHAEDIIRSSHIWYSDPMSFNDPFECGRFFDITCTREEVVRQVVSHLAKNGTPSAEAAIQAERDIPQTGQELDRYLHDRVDSLYRGIAKTGILCLTSDCTHPLMWAHYADGHKGVCLGLRALVRECHIKFIGSAQRVEYCERMPVVDVTRERMVESVKKIYLTKPAYFAYENEWRIMDRRGGPGCKPLPPGVIGAVILGCKVSDGDRDRVIRSCKDYDSDVEIVQAERDPVVFGLKFKSLATV